MVRASFEWPRPNRPFGGWRTFPRKPPKWVRARSGRVQATLIAQRRDPPGRLRFAAVALKETGRRGLRWYSVVNSRGPSTLNWEAIAAIGEAVGGFAVIASLIYLAVQIRQSRQLERAASIRELFAKGIEMTGYTALHPEKLDTIRRGVADFSQLSVEQIDIFNGWGMHCLVTVEQAMYMHRDGLLPEASWRAFENFGLAIIRSPGGSAWWSTYSVTIGQEFVVALNEVAGQAGDERPSIYDLFPHWRH
jgi:hypothetical protein